MAMKHVTVGPFGGQGGEPWDDGIFTGVRYLIICSGPVINSIRIEYDQNGESKVSKKQGGEGGVTNMVKINYPSEYILSIWGYYSSDSALQCIQSLTIESNKRTYGPFGTEKGKYFKFPLISGKILGFHGRSGNYLHCFGAHSEPTSDPSQSISIGSFGGHGEDQWDDGKYSTVRQFKISYGSVIDSIQIEYDDKGESKWSLKHGRSEGGTKKAILLNYPDEYLISVSGYLNEDSAKAVIQSLTFQSNRKQYGPYGVEKGQHFSTQSTYGKIVGFHGSSGLYLDSIGAYFEPFIDTPQPMIVGPFGGYRGPQWDDGIYTTVRQFIIYAGVIVDSIQIEYDKNGQSLLSKKHGESTGGTKSTVKFEYPDEFLVSISGYYSLDSAFVGLQSLTIHSNKRIYGPFGSEIGIHFMLRAPDSGSKIIGLHGRSGSHLDAIGAYFTSKPISSPCHRFITVEPFGGQDGDEWDDGKYNGVKQLIIYSGIVIDSIQIEYDQNGQSKWSEKHGDEGGGKNTVELDYPSEHLLSIWGYYSSDSAVACVQSLTIESNKRIYGPFGTEKGKYFKFPLTSGKIVGFYGRSGYYLHCFGAYLEPISDPNQPISIGSFGGQGGDQWDDGEYSTVRQLTISYGSVIDFIQIEYDDKGMSKWSVKHGKSEGGTKKTVQLNYPDEYLTSISGYLSEDSTKAVIQSLTIQSNKKQYGPYGVEKGKHFSTQSINGMIVGFHGRSDLYLDSIGAYFDPFPDTQQPVIVGPFGGYGGNQWDDDIYTTVRQIIINAGLVVDSIQIEYDDNGQSVWGKKHGESIGGTQHMIKFDYPDEFLLSISGYYSLESAFVGLQSLKIHSNRRTYGPFGTEIGNHFTSPTPSLGSKIIGFHGRSGSHLDAIGAYFTSKLTLSPSHRLITFGPFGGQGGAEWDDGKYSGVKQLIIYSGSVIDSIQIEYDNNGNSKWSEKHGKSQGGTKYTVKLDYPEEFLVSIRGYYSQWSNSIVVFSLALKSNKKTYGPFGLELGSTFESPQITGKIVGFHGRSGDWLDSIGAHFESLDQPSNG